jgi:hypothetical protein
MAEDRLRRCVTTLSNGGRCWKYATYTSHHCEKHEREMRQAESVKDLMRLKRLGRYVVVRDTSVAISDDMQAAVGPTSSSFVAKSFFARRRTRRFRRYAGRTGWRFAPKNNLDPL